MKKKANLTKVNKTVNSEAKKTIIIIVVVLLLLAFMYFLTTVILEKNSGYQKDEPGEAVIQYDEILAGESFSQPEEEYYVIYYDSEEETDNLASLITSYQAKTDVTKLYSVDLTNGMNKKYITEDEIVTSSPSALRVKNPTLIRFKGHEVVETIDNREEIKEIISQ